jgi:hypothetical protein
VGDLDGLTSIIDLMPKIGMPTFGKCQILHTACFDIGNFWQLLILAIVGLPSIGNAKCWHQTNYAQHI